ncbi:hypothetical protein RR46_15289 [Papilio xuthus]|uniref:Uncharacterized protein n=1 Tax=Papilio xuthus TaxID=66420 RepID=A0A194PL02_PAPXU|nr:hypothetical protein RR46_15289 [Papilio xuthus]
MPASLRIPNEHRSPSQQIRLVILRTDDVVKPSSARFDCYGFIRSKVRRSGVSQKRRLGVRRRRRRTAGRSPVVGRACARHLLASPPPLAPAGPGPSPPQRVAPAARAPLRKPIPTTLPPTRTTLTDAKHQNGPSEPNARDPTVPPRAAARPSSRHHANQTHKRAVLVHHEQTGFAQRSRCQVHRLLLSGHVNMPSEGIDLKYEHGGHVDNDRRRFP